MDSSNTPSCPKGRPLSPHIQVYKPQLTSILSIMHRGTGIALSLTAFLSVWGLYSLKISDPTSLSHPLFQTIMSSLFGILCMVIITFSLFFHMSNGVRHLFWDVGKGFDIDTAYRSGYAVLIISIVGTLLVVGGLL
jgi:succinate dehydrogenase / fumarate reductase cytochrome b subunit